MPQNDTVIKHYKSGVELEHFILDRKGNVSNWANELISKIKKLDPTNGVKHEIAAGMVEIATEAELNIPYIGRQLCSDLELLIKTAEANDLSLYPFGTYPGAFMPEIFDTPRYAAQQKIFGKQRLAIAGRVAGLHCHFTLPKGVFDENRRQIKNLIFSKHKESLINIFNLFTALDPALTCFAQSSPFYQGDHLAKDSRLVVYRGGEVFNYPQGCCAIFDGKYGGLQPYLATGTDLLHFIERQFDFFKKLLKELEINIKTFLKHGSILSVTWAPVRINAHGTTEHRGMDSNLPSIVIALSLLIKYIAKEVQEKFISVVASDEAINNPFAYDGKKIIIPPASIVRSHLQPKSAFEGLSNPDIFRYCQALLKLGKSLIPEDRLPFLSPLDNMLKSGETISDKLIKLAKESGWNGKSSLNPELCRHLALSSAEMLKTDLTSLKQPLVDFTPKN